MTSRGRLRGSFVSVTAHTSPSDGASRCPRGIRRVPGVAHVGHYRSPPLARPVVLPTIACQAAALAMIAMMCGDAVCAVPEPYPDRPGSPWRIRGVKGCWRIERGRRAPDLRGNLRPVGGTKRPRRSGRRRENAGQPSLSCGSLAVDTRHSPCFSTLHSPRRTVSVRCRSLPCHIVGPSLPRVFLRWPSLLASPVRSHPMVRGCLRLQGRSSPPRHRVRRRHRHHRPPRSRVMQEPTTA